jgi:hypothetical protein
MGPMRVFGDDGAWRCHGLNKPLGVGLLAGARCIRKWRGPGLRTLPRGFQPITACGPEALRARNSRPCEVEREGEAILRWMEHA